MVPTPVARMAACAQTSLKAAMSVCNPYALIILSLPAIKSASLIPPGHGTATQGVTDVANMAATNICNIPFGRASHRVGIIPQRAESNRKVKRLF